MAQEGWLLLATGISGFTAAVLVAVFAHRGTNPGIRMIRCFMGFFVAVVWIMAIADEVVNVLKVQSYPPSMVRTSAYTDIRRPLASSLVSLTLSSALPSLLWATPSLTSLRTSL